VVTVLPGSSDAFQNASWNDLLPYYEELASRPLDRGNVESWLQGLVDARVPDRRGDRAGEFRVREKHGRLQGGEAQLSSARDRTRAEEQRTKLQERLVKLGYVRAGLETTDAAVSQPDGVFSPANVPLQTELAKLSTEWRR